MSTSWPIVIAVAALATVPAAYGQAPAAPADTHLGPIRCYVDATERSNLERLKAKQLCTGAISEAPARCFAEATDRVGMSDLEAVRLCQAATSLAPAMCAARLDDATDLVTSSLVAYCAALRWYLLPAGTGGSPECVEVALDRTLLPEREAARLCAGSASIAPVACYELGDDRTTLSERDLVDLCTTHVIVPPLQPWYP